MTDDPARNSRVLISGASIAGPALALWLERYGFDVTVVEKAPDIRQNGQAVDFKGKTHLTVLERMGVLADIRQARSENGRDGIIVNSVGRKIGVIPAAFSGGEIEIARGDLSRILFERTATSCEYIFGDSITSLKETPDHVEVTFQRSGARVFDLVIGADGIHSNVRKLVFGPEVNYVRHLGHYYALASIDGELGREEAMYNEPGRMASTGGPKAPAFFVFASELLDYDRDDILQQKKILIEAYRGMKWKVPELLQRVADAQDFYMDSISRVTASAYSKGRCALLGDSAYGNALGGFGTGLAVVGAYVLAGELRQAKGDYKVAYGQYEAKFRNYAKVSQAVNAGRLLAPSTRLGLYLRNRMFSISPLFNRVIDVMDRFATDIELEDYPDKG